MSLENLGHKHFTLLAMQEIDSAIDKVEAEVLVVTQNLSDESRQRYGSINEQNKLFTNKVYDFAQTAPQLRSPDVDWAEFEADYNTRRFADTRILRLQNIIKMLSDLKIVHDYDNYHDSLTDYDYAKYKSGTHTPGFTEKVRELSQFFPRTGTTLTKADDQE